VARPQDGIASDSAQEMGQNGSSDTRSLVAYRMPQYQGVTGIDCALDP
jgi:hypothetical protein